jgi:bacteriorhodopsin
VGVHPNIHIPKESWPHWTWYAIECVIVIAVSLLVSREITDSIEGLAPEVQNYLFIGILGIFFLVWYIGIRRIILTKFLKNGY